MRLETSSGVLKTSMSESTSRALHEIANCVAVLSNKLARVRRACSVKDSASALGTSAADAGTTPSTSAGQSFKEVPQTRDFFQVIVFLDL